MHKKQHILKTVPQIVYDENLDLQESGDINNKSSRMRLFILDSVETPNDEGAKISEMVWTEYI